MKIIIEMGGKSAGVLGIVLFVLGGILVLLSLIASITTNFVFALLLVIAAAMLLFLGIFLISKSMNTEK